MKRSTAVEVLTTHFQMAAIRMINPIHGEPMEINVPDDVKEELQEEFGIGDPVLLAMQVTAEAVIEVLEAEGLIFDPEED